MDPVLVIGGCGGLGYHIVRQLLDEGHATNVTVFDVNIGNADTIITNPGLRYVQGSLGLEKDVHEVVSRVKPKVTFHTASPKLMAFQDPGMFDQVNITGTRYLVDALRLLAKTTPESTRLLVYTSSSSVVHDNKSDLINATESLPYCLEPAQAEHYTHTKAVAESLVLAANQPNPHSLSGSLMTSAIRACMLFGEGDKTMTPQMIANARSGRTKIRIGPGTNLYDFAYLGDTGNAHILCAQHLLREEQRLRSNGLIQEGEKVNGEAFVITSDDPWPFWDMPLAMGLAAGISVPKSSVRQIPVSLYYGMMVVLEWTVWLVSLGRRTSQFNRKMVPYLTMTRTFDISKAKERLGYKPRVGMQEGIKRSVEWFLQHEDKVVGSGPGTADESVSTLAAQS